jgi:hypothetical protein
LNSATNFAVNIVAIHTLSLSALGSFGIAFTMYALGLGVSRAFTSEPLIVRWSDATEGEWRGATSDAMAAAVAVGLLTGLVGLASAPLLGSDTAGAIVAIAVFMPGLLLQDGVRLAFFARGRPEAAAVNDILWIVFLVPAYLVVVGTGSPSETRLLLAWGGAGTAAALVGCAQVKAVPSLLGPARWWRAQRDLGIRFVGEFAGRDGVLRLSDYGVVGVAGLATLGLFRTASVLMGPIRIAVTGLALHAIGEGARNRAFDVDRDRRRALLKGAALISAAGLGWTAVLFVLPQSLVVRLVGDEWPKVRPVFGWASLGWIGFSVCTVAMVQLRITANARTSLKAQLQSSVPLAGCILIGAAVGGGVGAGVGLAVGYALIALIWWHHVTSAAADVPAGAPPDPDPLPPGEPIL